MSPLQYLLVLISCRSALAVLGEFYTNTTPTIGFFDISSTGTAVTIPGTDTYVSVSLPFTFPFFAYKYTSIFISENGLLTFGEGSTAYTNECPFTFKKSKFAIALLWTDLDAFSSGRGSIKYRPYTSCPSSIPAVKASQQCFIVQYSDVPYEGQNLSDPSASGRFQAVIFATGDVLLQYSSVGADLDYTVGLKSSSPVQDYFMPYCNPASAAVGVKAGLAIMYAYNPLKDCGNKVCNTGENCVTCVTDCQRPCGLCNDSNCDTSTETCLSCPTDCGACCGNENCDTEYGENCANCPRDCASPCCGDGICNASSETSCTCPGDCPGDCCGDGNCTGSETCVTCLRDCSPPCSQQSVNVYTFSQNKPFLWRDLVTSSGTQLSFTDAYASLNMNFTFPFFYTSFTSVYVGVNGVLSFGSPVTGAPTQCPYNSLSPTYIVAPLWADFALTSSSAVYYQLASPCGEYYSNLCLVVQYNDLALKTDTDKKAAAKFQASLTTEGNIFFSYYFINATLENIANVGIKGGTSFGETSLSFMLFGCNGYGAVQNVVAPTSMVTVRYQFSGCGDGSCNATKGEDCVSCKLDCKQTKCNRCGDGYCDSAINETCGTCPADCGYNNTDTDGDGVTDCLDGCPFNAKKTAPGLCGCSWSGNDSLDTDGDEVLDCFDVCPTNPTKTYSVGICGCQIADTDTDGDGSPDCVDQCINDSSKTGPQACGCGEKDKDSDGDDVQDCIDGCPKDPWKTLPGVCGCGVPDTNIDGDSALDCQDGCPNDSTKQAPGSCGCNKADIDSDGDNVLDCNDPCPYQAYTQPTACGCFGGDTVDTDKDGVPNCKDKCPTDPKKSEPGVCGCGSFETDSDGDGTPDCNDLCPFSALKTEPGVCGCEQADTDTDDDGTLDCKDKCPLDKNKIVPGNCGCGKSEALADVDTDGDRVADCVDECPNDATKVTDNDTDGDGVYDCEDKCPLDKYKIDPAFCGCGATDPSSTAGKTAAQQGFSLAGWSYKNLVCVDSTDAYISSTAGSRTGRRRRSP